MTDEQLAAALARREGPRALALKAQMSAHVEPWLRSVATTKERVDDLSLLLGDAAALYAVQVGVTRDELLRRVGEAFDLYEHVVKGAPSESAIRGRAEDLRHPRHGEWFDVPIGPGRSVTLTVEEYEQFMKGLFTRG